MASSRGEKPAGRFTRSGHTNHAPRPDEAAGPPARPPGGPPAGPPARPPDGPPARPPDGPARQRSDGRLREPYYEPYYSPNHEPQDEHRGYRDSPPSYLRQTTGAEPYPGPEPHYDDRPQYDDRRPQQPAPAVPQGATTAGAAARLIGRSAVSGTNRAARTVTRKVISASKADGADRSGLTPLIWNQVLSYGTDAMITVALAGTVFFGASSNAQRGNVLLYLLITMAPFAVVAPIIGPALDRLQHGRRWTMAGTAIGRAVLAIVMAGHPTDLLVLYPCALGSLVLSKAYGVVRAAAAPRLVPPGMTLTEANARVTMFGLASTIVLGGLVGTIIKVTGSYTIGLLVTAVGFAACAVFAVRLPKQVDSAVSAPRHPQEPPRPRTQQPVARLSRIQAWAKHGFDPHVVVALQGESAMRLLSGLLTIYLAFYVESTQHGFAAALDLAFVIGAAGAGNFVGTAIGTRLKLASPETVIVVSTCVSGLVCLLCALVFSIAVAAVVMLVSASGNALSKIALDALIQRDVVETLRSSAFARSETFLQLAWVIGAAIGVALPSTTQADGAVGLLVAGVLTGAAGAVVVLRRRATAGRPYSVAVPEVL